MRLKILIFCSIAICIGGCASQMLQSYVGQPVSAIVADRGPPATSFDVDQNTRAFVWQTSATYNSPAQISTTGSKDEIFNTWNETTNIQPSQTTTTNCTYVVYAKRANNGLEGPAGWIVTSYKAPALECEGNY